MRYRRILFDADGTLFDFKKGESVAVCAALRSFGIEADDALVAEYSEINDSLWKMLERGEIEKNVLIYRRFEILAERHGFLFDAREMAKRYMEELSGMTYFLDEAQKLCERLCDKAELYIVTNGLEYVQKRRYAESGLSKYFKGIFISGELGYEKPSEKYFECVASRIGGFEKSGTLIVGDSLSSDIKGGINYGIDTCWYNPEGKSKPDGMDITHISQSHRDVYEFITDTKGDF